jgi:hypothetical protein
VIDAASQGVLEELLRRESRSVLQYVRDSYPWTTGDRQEELEKVKGLLTSESEALATLGRWLTKHRVPLPFLGSYPSRFTTINFVSLGYLLPLLVSTEKSLVADLERDLAKLTDPDARIQAQNLLELKKKNLQSLEQIQTSLQQPPVAG